MDIELLKAILKEYLTTLGGSLAAVGAVAALITWFIQYRFGLALANANSALAAINKRQEITFSRLHEKRADAIAELFGMLVDIQTCVANLNIINIPIKKGEAIADLQKRYDEQTKEVETKLEAYWLFERKKKIYFSEHLTKKLAFMNTLFNEHLELKIYSAQDPAEVRDEMIRVNKEIAFLLTVIRKEFSTILGVENEKGIEVAGID